MLATGAPQWAAVAQPLHHSLAQSSAGWKPPREDGANCVCSVLLALAGSGGFAIGELGWVTPQPTNPLTFMFLVKVNPRERFFGEVCRADMSKSPCWGSESLLSVCWLTSEFPSVLECLSSVRHTNGFSDR